MVLTVSFALSLVIGLSCHHHRRIISASLTSASRCQDHATSPSATLHIRLCARRVHRIPWPNVRDDSRNAPFASRDAAINELCLAREESELFFAKGLDSGSKSAGLTPFPARRGANGS